MPRGRPRKLSERDMEEIIRRLVNGETMAALAREYGVSKTTMSRNFSGRLTRIQGAAWRLARAEMQLQAMPPEARRAVRDLVSAMRAGRGAQK
jgi:transposase-like protein